MSLISKIFWFTIHVDSWFWRIIDRICCACAIFRSIPNLQARTDRRINLGWAGEPTVPPGTLAVHWLEEHVRVSLIFAVIFSLMLFTVFTLVYVLYFEDFLIHYSWFWRRINQICWACAILCPIPIICRPVRTDRQTDGRTN